MDKIESFFTKHNPIHLKKGEIFLRPNEPINFIGYIKSGYIRIYSVDKYGQEVTVPFFRSLLNFSIMMVKTEEKNRYYYEAITNAEVYMVDKDEAMNFFRQNSDVSNQIMKNVSESFLNIVEQMGTLLSGNSYNKVAATIASMTERSGFPITHKLIASVTGLTRETVTLQLLKLEKEGVIAKNKRKIRVIDHKKMLKAIRER